MRVSYTGEGWPMGMMIKEGRVTETSWKNQYSKKALKVGQLSCKVLTRTLGTEGLSGSTCLLLNVSLLPWLCQWKTTFLVLVKMELSLCYPKIQLVCLDSLARILVSWSRIWQHRFHHGWPLHMAETNTLVMPSNPDLSGTSCVCNIHHPEHAEYVARTWYF